MQEKFSLISQDKYFLYFYISLPIERIDSTLKRRMRISVVGDIISAKTGRVVIVFPIHIKTE